MTNEKMVREYPPRYEYIYCGHFKRGFVTIVTKQDLLDLFL